MTLSDNDVIIEPLLSLTVFVFVPPSQATENGHFKNKMAQETLKVEEWHFGTFGLIEGHN